jgi:hypothetical protein
VPGAAFRVKDEETMRPESLRKRYEFVSLGLM